MSEESLKCFFTCHHNWRWVVEAGCERCCDGLLDSTKVSRFKELPGYQMAIKTYALFRLDIRSASETLLRVGTTNVCMEHLDPKDALFRIMDNEVYRSCMPMNYLISWDAESFSFIPAQFPMLLKAPLGSGGYGLYYVYNWEDVRQLLNGHKRRAEKEVNFLDSLRNDYGEVPSWSLQRIIPSVKYIFNGIPRKCQFRGYLVICHGKLFLYKHYEVRMPLWNIDIDNTIRREHELYKNSALQSSSMAATLTSARNRWSYEVENECCGSGHARPYNEERNKSQTERFLLSEVFPHETHETESFSCVYGALRACLLHLARGIQASIEQHRNHALEAEIEASLAIAGVDLLVEELCDAVGQVRRYQAYVVELNNNPAMANPDKHRMSQRYKLHLIEFAKNTMELGIFYGLHRDMEGNKENKGVKEKLLQKCKGHLEFEEVI